jgi:ABC-type multidrug transport system fused ATPase/permease subunit
VALGSLVVLWQGGRQVAAGTLPLEDLLAYLLYLGFFYGPITEINGLVDSIEQTKASAGKVFDIIEQEPTVVEHAKARSADSLSGTIEFRKVMFSYTPGQPVLTEVSFHVEPGEMIALVGPSGAGKSTLTSLIPRFYDVDSGQVLVGGYDVRDLTLESLRNQIGMVLQDTFLFNGTVYENIAYGRLGATREEVLAASRLARCHDFVSTFKDGYDTVVGERGTRLSGGQKQRVAIARAILKRAPILILDEATSSVDTQSEELIQQGLDQLIAGRTTIVIAHRLSTVRRANRILFILEGKIVESGTHKELLAAQGPYSRLYRSQCMSPRI